MKIKRIKHVGVIVRDTEASRRLWEECFGIPLGSTENSKRRLALYQVGESMIELIASLQGLCAPRNRRALHRCDLGRRNHEGVWP